MPSGINHRAPLPTTAFTCHERRLTFTPPGKCKNLMSIMHHPRQNRLLAALPDADFERLAQHLELAPMHLGDILYESGEQLDYAHFPTTSIISLQYVMANGASAEMAGIGNEGMLGVSLFMGGNTTPNRAIVQTAGNTYRLPSTQLREEFNRAGAMMRLLLRYTQASLTQMAQSAVCNRYHTIEQQLCRWMLVTLDRLASDELAITQELIAGTLGVRREGITEAAQKLQHLGMIRYRRGHIKIIDRLRLETHACECYTVVRDEFDRLMSDPARRATVPWPGSVIRRSGA